MNCRVYQVFLYLFLFFQTVYPQEKIWKISSAPYRIKIKKESGPWHSNVGYAEIFPCSLDTKDIKIKVYRKNSTEVNYKILWAERGEAIKILFDCSSRDTEYDIYLTTKAIHQTMSWEPKAGLILCTKKRIEGAVDTLAQVKKMWQESTETFGCSLVPMVFQGVHLHGPSLDFLSYYLGYFEIKKEGTYFFATASDDASFLLIDGQEVAAWPGWHGPHQGVYGQYSGQIFLKAGVHKLEYYHVQGTGGTAAVAGWRDSPNERWRLIPPQAFLPVAFFSPLFCESSFGVKEKAFFTWQMVRHSMPEDHLAIVEILLKVADPLPHHTYRWTMDDGTQKEGEKITHLFLKPAMRMVKLEVWEGEKKTGDLSQKIHLHPKWEQINTWDDRIFSEHTQEIFSRDLSKAPIEDILYLNQFACAVKDKKWLESLATIFLLRQKEWKEEHASVLCDFAIACLTAEIAQNTIKKIFETILSLSGADPKILDRTRLHLAYLLFFFEGKIEESKKLAKSILPYSLSLPDRNTLKILNAEFLALENQMEKAREILSSIYYASPSPSFGIKRNSRLEQARLLLIQKKVEEAKEILKEWEKENPLERLNLDTLFVMVRVYLANQEYPFALVLCRKLFHLSTLDRDKAWTLFYLVEIHKHFGNKQESENLLKKLYSEFRYSEAAAMAKERWAD